ncbi:hypothetical protein IWQ47_004749 [Aquimarina sp. EL_43]|nr:hypothetical protein [Aquimarina sp. EL_35]MBG6153497.1 hypothetical protein [Aquimarina sp. EL_32]MBG6171653.1 hypothetical protein [Aquimarina sp. EL_43]
MKKILNVTGVTKLSKEQQQDIIGSSTRQGWCCPSGKGCRIPGLNFCEPGFCLPTGVCIFH